MNYIEWLNLPTTRHNDLAELINTLVNECEEEARMTGAKDKNDKLEEVHNYYCEECPTVWKSDWI